VDGGKKRGVFQEKKKTKGGYATDGDKGGKSGGKQLWPNLVWEGHLRYSEKAQGKKGGGPFLKPGPTGLWGVNFIHGRDGHSPGIRRAQLTKMRGSKRLRAGGMCGSKPKREGGTTMKKNKKPSKRDTKGSQRGNLGDKENFSSENGRKTIHYLRGKTKNHRAGEVNGIPKKKSAYSLKIV